tara:strand:+ start:132 stop:1082 length:951 start_codon:yes stop_codon:yes gene_type:complete
MPLLIKQFIDFIFSFIFTFFLLKKLIPYLIKIIPALPSERGMHEFTKASSGGLSFILIYSILVLYQGFYLPLFALPMAMIGVIDDKFNISRIVRILFQILTLVLIIFYLDNNANTFAYQLIQYGSLGYIFLILLGTSTINFVNFMDGIDGLVCGSMIVILFTLNGEVHYLLPLIGTLSGFLYFNWYPSKIFMGDIGSLFLGTFLVSLIYSSTSGFEGIIKILLLCSPLFLDAFFCILRRLINKKNIFNSHKSHLYQRLVSNGMKHSTVSIIYISSIALLSIFYTYSSLKFLLFISCIIFLLGVFLDKKYAISFHKS